MQQLAEPGSGQIALLRNSYSHTALPRLGGAGGEQEGARLFMLALKPGLFPLPRTAVSCFSSLLFTAALILSRLFLMDFSPGAPSTLSPRSALQRFHAPLGHKRGILFPHPPRSPRLQLCSRWQRWAEE